MTTRTSCRTQRDWVSFGTLERRGKVALSSPSFQLFKPINSRKLSLMKSLFSMSTDPSPSFFLLKSFHQKCARAIKLPLGPWRDPVARNGWQFQLREPRFLVFSSAETQLVPERAQWQSIHVSNGCLK